MNDNRKPTPREMELERRLEEVTRLAYAWSSTKKIRAYLAKAAAQDGRKG